MQIRRKFFGPSLVSGIIAAENILKNRIFKDFKHIKAKEIQNTYLRDNKNNQSVLLKVQSMIDQSLGFYRNKKDLENCIIKLKNLLDSNHFLKDKHAKQLILSTLWIATSALLREESGGNHNRLDFPNPSENWQCSIAIHRLPNGKVGWEKITR